MRHGSALDAHSGAGVLGWAQFRESLQNLDLTQVAGRAADFRSHLTDGDFGPLKVRRVGSGGIALHAERSKSRIDVFRETIVWIGIVLSGAIQVRQSEGVTSLAPGDFTLLDATRPYGIDVPEGPVETLWIGAPRDLAVSRLIDVDGALGLNLNDSGPGAMTSRILRAAFAESSSRASGEEDRIAHVLLDMLATGVNARFAHAGASRYRGAVVRRIKRRIEANLADESLCVSSIAREQGLSARYLAKLFETEGETISAWIWRRRLERCRTALLRAEAGETISRIAFAHGFKSASHFSRAFRERFGESPSAALASARRQRAP